MSMKAREQAIETITLQQLEEGNVLALQFEKRSGILPVAVQETATGRILMLASVNEQALTYTLQHKVAVFYSTTRKQLWVKGETSGNTLRVDNVLVDCDQDALVFQVTLLEGGVCHTLNQLGENRKACFYRSVDFKTTQLTFIEK